jgi:hypothetical protein
MHLHMHQASRCEARACKNRSRSPPSAMKNGLRLRFLTMTSSREQAPPLMLMSMACSPLAQRRLSS